MHNIKIHQLFIPLALCVMVQSCKVPAIVSTEANTVVPHSFQTNRDTNNASTLHWKTFFKDQYLLDLIDTALKNNQELKITLQEIEIAKNEIQVRKGALLPSVGIHAGNGLEKVARYTSQGAGDASTEITPGKKVPDVLTDGAGSMVANWEIDIWKKLRNAKQASVNRYLSTIEGKNFVITNLIAEVANSYYELLALDSRLDIIRQNIKLQQNALEVVRVQKEAARTTELAVKKFEAEVLASQSLEFETLQQIQETENKINFLLARYPQEIKREKRDFSEELPAEVQTGIPSQLLQNRPDIKQAELQLAAARLDVKVARAEFYPSLDITSMFGLQAFKPSYLYKLPESLLFSLAGDMAAPIINRKAIKAEFNSANARQLQVMYNYERTILNAYLEVSTQLSKISNLDKSYQLKSQQVEALNKSIEIATDLFKSARADYFEVLMTQRDALETKLDLIETKRDQLNAVVNIYRALGGGWN